MLWIGLDCTGPMAWGVFSHGLERPVVEGTTSRRWGERQFKNIMVAVAFLYFSARRAYPGLSQRHYS